MVLLIRFVCGIDWPRKSSGARPQAYKKTHDRFQPWVFVDIQITFDKRQRHRHIRRPPAGPLVGFLSTSGERILLGLEAVKQ
jgi:hypothetical protein